MDAPLNPRNISTPDNEAGQNYPNPSVPPQIDQQRNYSQSGNASVETDSQSYYDPSGALVEKQQQIIDDPYIRRQNLLYRSTQAIYFVMSVVEVFLGLRLLLRIINADTTSGFTNFIYNISGPFVAPFNGIFNNDQLLNQGGVVEFSTVLAMGIYALLTYGLVRLLYLIFEPTRSSREVYTASRRRGV